MNSSPIRAVLDTNVLVSALLFEKGRLSWLRPCWQKGQITPVLAETTARELLRVLAYPKFRLQSVDRERLLEVGPSLRRLWGVITSTAQCC